ncbi:MAG: hypothetical protein ACON4Z_04595 [Planctomycetota bacterium]
MTALPPGANNVLETAQGTLYFDGFQLQLDAGSGSVPLLTFPSFTFGSFSAPIGATEVLFGESSNGGIWSIPLSGAPAQLVANVAFNYDAVLLDDDRALVSAKTGGFSAPDNDVVFVDLLTGQTQLLAQFAGASGPLAIDAAGDVYYATAPATFPAPSGTVEIWRLPRAVVDAAVLSGQVLGAADATLVVQGLDAAGDLAFDDQGDLLFVDWYQGRIGQVTGADGPNPTLAPTVIDYAGSSVSATTLQFDAAASAGGAVFDAFQPQASSLRIHETDYVSVSQVRAISAARPALAASAPSPVPAGTFSLSVAAGPAGGIGVLLLETAASAGPVTLAVPGLRQPLFLDAALVAAPALLPLAFDATGAASVALVNPGFPQGLDVTAQAAFVSAAGVLGSSTALVLQVGP